VACGEDVNPQTCTFFVNSLRTDLANQQIGVQVFSEQETLVQSFYVSPSLLPFTDVMLRLIEDGPPDNTYLYVGGFSFDSEAQNENGFQLPSGSNGKREPKRDRWMWIERLLQGYLRENSRHSGAR
jgi:hypothetical protein